MADLITRQAAIDVLDRNHILGQGLLNDTLDHIADAIMAVPSAQPETHEERMETHTCDLISRQAALDALDKRFDSIPMEQTTEILLLRKDLRELPSAQPEKRTEEHTETHGVCLDAIDRQAVIDTVRKIILGFFSDEDDVMNDTEKTLLSVNKAVCNGVRELPHAPSRPHDISKAKFSCPICGAEMEVTVDEWDEGGER